MKTAGKPSQPIEKSTAGASLLTQVIVAKYADHLPLHRQAKIFRRFGVELSDRTMCGWMRQCADLLDPLYKKLKDFVLASKVVGTDDTPVKVLDRKLPQTRKGRIWPYVGDRDHPAVIYDYTPTRERAGPEKFLKDFRGHLQADAYAVYDSFFTDPARGMVEVGCWAHYLDSGIIRSDCETGTPARGGNVVGGILTPDKASQTFEECEQLWRWPPFSRGRRVKSGSLPKGLQHVALHLKIGRNVSACGGHRCMTEIISNHRNIDSRLQKGNGTTVSHDVWSDSPLS